jgi:hypothetical protein
MIRQNPFLNVYVAANLPQISSSPRIVTPIPHPRDHNAQIRPPLFQHSARSRVLTGSLFLRGNVHKANDRG